MPSTGPKWPRWGRSRWFAWWYFSISVGFLFLAIYFWLRGGSLLPGILRLIISFSFAVLGWLQLKVSKGED
jgi:hypothetical protein